MESLHSLFKFLTSLDHHKGIPDGKNIAAFKMLFGNTFTHIIFHNEVTQRNFPKT